MAFKTYTTVSAARAAIRKAGLHTCPLLFPKVGGKIEPSVGVELLEDRIYVENEKGFRTHPVEPTVEE